MSRDAMSDFESELRKLVREIVRDEIADALAERQSGSDYVSTSTAARIADVTTHTVRRWIREGKLVAYGDGKRLRLRRADVEDLLASDRGSQQNQALTPEQMAVRDFS